MKRFILYIFSVSLVISVLSSGKALAKNQEENAFRNKAEIAVLLESIPVYVTFAQDIESTDIKSRIADQLEVLCDVDSRKTEGISRELDYSTKTYKLSFSEKSAILDCIVFQKLLEGVYRKAQQGVVIHYVNFWLHSDEPLRSEVEDVLCSSQETGNMLRSCNHNATDEAFWRSVTTYFANHNELEYRYIESEVYLSTPQRNPEDLTNSFNWGNFLIGIAKVAFEQKLGSASAWINVTLGTMNSIMGSVPTPYTVTFGQAGESKIKTWINGHNYEQAVYVHNMRYIGGQPFFYVGAVENFVGWSKYDCVYPISKKTATTYNYYSVLKQKSLTGATAGYSNHHIACMQFYPYYMTYPNSNLVGYIEEFDFSDLASTITN